MKYQKINEYYTLYENGEILSNKTKKFLSKRKNNNGYFYCEIYINKERKRIYLHKYVAEYFIKNVNKKPQVNHKDGNKENNNSSNLEWVTCKENIIHAHKLGIGGKPPFKKVIQSNNKYIIKRWDSIKSVVNSLNISYQSISNCLSNRAKTAGGFKWNYDTE